MKHEQNGIGVLDSDMSLTYQSISVNIIIDCNSRGIVFFLKYDR